VHSGPPGPRRPRSGGVANASCMRFGKHRDRAARPAPSAFASAAIVPTATTCEGATFRTLDDVNPIPRWPARSRNHGGGQQAGRGCHGFGGKASLIGCKITAANRLPASFFVSVATIVGISPPGVRLDATTAQFTGGCTRSFAAGFRTHGARAGFTLTAEVVLTPPLRKRRCEP